MLRAVIARSDKGQTLTRSELEERFLELCRAAGIPRPEVNAHLVLADGDAIEVDFLWRAQRLVVETDGRASHATDRAFERDRRRDQRLMLAGLRVMRCTWRQVVAGSAELAETVLSLLRFPPTGGRPHRSHAGLRPAGR